MFGYIYVNEQELKLKDYTAYRSFYCGLCRNLYQRYGRAAQMMLNYDLTFLSILLSGLYEPETVTESHRCIPHPVREHQMVSNEAVSYAADMCVLLSYQKLMDDWEDERKYNRRAIAGLLKSGYKKLSGVYPRQVKALETNLHLMHDAEQQNLHDVDYVAGLTGHFLGELFVWKDDIWQEELRAMGFYLGKFIYLMDALEDVDRDRKHGNYNLFSEYGSVWDTENEQKIRDMLTGMMTEAARFFERLPILQNAEIIRNILYSGVWCRYAGLRAENQKKSSEHDVQNVSFSEKEGKVRS